MSVTISSSFSTVVLPLGCPARLQLADVHCLMNMCVLVPVFGVQVGKNRLVCSSKRVDIVVEVGKVNTCLCE